ncbi:M56 family metallopeptidase [Ulvibacterium marinum]|uniref:M56 family metallopeptidase n=1 Tax=Ulvibacterium marinum TaxID=2419782 RepID=UPI0024949B67|nr:M56 family metallopeptidase [Ulvibacterium marinum]
MIQYVLECIAFQLVFLAIYDFWLKRETFFQWNRVYLIGTYLLSMILPWVKIEAFRTEVPTAFQGYPEFLWNLNNATITVTGDKGSTFAPSWELVLLFSGMILTTVFFAYKLFQIRKLKRLGEVHYFNEFTRVILPNSTAAFSFLRAIFLGDKVVEREHDTIIKHELVHIRQRHSYDLIFFELMRILGWFNPLVYVYQNRISELHEFIADAHTAKTHKKEQVQLLLSQVFQTRNISFINQFFKKSLIKKRIVMLQKSKSSTLWKLKYMALIPMVMGMLLYSSCENEGNSQDSIENENGIITVGDVENLTQEEENYVYAQLKSLSEKGGDWELQVRDTETVLDFVSTDKDVFVTGLHNEPIRAQMTIDFKDSQRFYKNFMGSVGEGPSWKETYETNNMVPFAFAGESPIFPGCEDGSDQRACFNKMMQKHISKNFRYPQEAQQLGIQGRVNVIFTIDEAGNITDIRKRGPHQLLEDEVVRIIEKLPQMKPGKYEGKAVKVPFSIPITFSLGQASFSPASQDPDYVRLQQEQLKELSEEIQLQYRDAFPFAILEKAPIFPGCEDASDPKACFQQKIQRHIAKHFRYPQEAQKKGIQGRVNIMFLIDAEGNITNIAKRGPDRTLEDEAVRIISRLPKMKPGSQDGKNVSVPFSIPITFKLK